MPTVNKQTTSLRFPARRRTRSQAGFTMVELLAALAILAVLGTVIASLMLTGWRVMTTSTQGSNAAVLAQSIDTALSDCLHFARVSAPAGATIVEDPTFDSDSYLDVAGDSVRSARIVVDSGKLALYTASGTQSIPKSSGIYTDFTISNFSMFYDCDRNVFEGTYVIEGEGGYTRECQFACRTMVEETAA